MIEENSLNAKIEDQHEELEEKALRPKSLNDFVGQSRLKKNLDVFIKAAKKRNESLEHTLFYGPPGLGKTTLSMIIASEMDKKLYHTSGPSIEKQGDLASILTSLEEGDVLFIDEIHRLKPAVEEILYSALEDFHIDIVIGKGPTARSMKIDLPNFTLVGATTKVSSISAPLRDRLGQIFKLNFYTNKEIEQIIERSAKLLDVEVDQNGIIEISKRSRFTPRIANRLLRRVRDFAEIKHQGVITEEVANRSLEELEIDQLGLDTTGRDLLRLIIEKYSGGPVGLGTLAASLSEEESTIEEVYEPFLLQLGLIQRTPRGRLVTKFAYEHLGLTDKLSENKLL